MASWIELRVVIPRTRVEELIDLALSLGATGTEEAPPPGARVRYRQPWEKEDPPLPMFCTLKAWFEPETADAAELAIGAAARGTVERVEVKDEDWLESWKVHHKRVAVSPRLRVAPPWEAVEGDVIIPPGQAFGTGDHPTTLACLGGIDRLAEQCRTCLDVGCGSGVLALAAARLGMNVTGVDIDPICVQSSRENAELNGLSGDFSTTPIERVEGVYDLVVANLFAEVLVALAPELIRVTGRHLVLAGILADRADMVVAALSPPLALRERVEDGDWVSLHLERLP